MSNARHHEAGPRHLDDDTIAAWLEGTLAGDEADRARAHVADCPSCHALVGASAPEIEARAARAAGPRALPYVAAAVVLLGLGAWLLLKEERPSEPKPLTDALLARTAERLAGADGPLARFRPLSPNERAEPQHTVERGGLVVLSPRHGIRDPRPVFTWTPVPGATRYRVRILDEEGGSPFSIRTSETSVSGPPDGPALEPGTRYALHVEAETPAGQVRGGQAFFLLATEAAEAYEAGDTALVEAELDPNVRRTLRAHWAIRHELVHRADELLQANPGDPVAILETSALLDRLLGRTP